MKNNEELNALKEKVSNLNEEPREMSDEALGQVSGGASQVTFVYTIKNYDSLALIAQRYGTTVENIIELNNKNLNSINTGDKILVPYKE